MLYKRLK